MNFHDFIASSIHNENIVNSKYRMSVVIDRDGNKLIFRLEGNTQNDDAIRDIGEASTYISELSDDVQALFAKLELLEE